MKKLLFIFLFLSLYIGYVSANFVDKDKKEIINKVNIIQNSVNNANYEPIINLLSPNSQESFKNEIINNIQGQNIEYLQNIDSFEEISGNKIKISGIFSVKGVSWSTSGLSNYFIFEKMDNNWYLLESDFSKKLNSDYVLGILEKIIKIFVYILPFFLLLSGFWLWMIIDISDRDIKNKNTWIVLMVIFVWFGAIGYYFIPRRKHINKSNNKEKNLDLI